MDINKTPMDADVACRALREWISPNNRTVYGDTALEAAEYIMNSGCNDFYDLVIQYLKKCPPFQWNSDNPDEWNRDGEERHERREVLRMKLSQNRPP